MAGDDEGSDAPTGVSPSKARKTHIVCPNCDIVVGEIVPDGSIDATREPGQECDTCSPFERLLVTMKAADQLWERLEGRRKDYGPRQTALTQVHEAHRNFGNFIGTVDQVDVMAEEPASQESPTAESSQTASHKEEPSSTQDPSQSEVPHGKKRRLSSSSNTSPRSPKRAKAKKVDFDPSTNFHEDEQRKLRFFLRGAHVYDPGRYAAPEGIEYLDTSGYTQDFKAFWEVYWNGHRWVPQGEIADKDSTEVPGGGQSSGS